MPAAYAMSFVFFGCSSGSGESGLRLDMPCGVSAATHLVAKQDKFSHVGWGSAFPKGIS